MNMVTLTTPAVKFPMVISSSLLDLYTFTAIKELSEA